MPSHNMVGCNNCGDDVPEVWRHRTRDESMTNGSVSWVCRGCHPTIPPTRETTATDRTVAIADGGTPTIACPSCGGATVDGQGLYDCLECSWSGSQ